jgi:hypothetical protein
MEKVLLPLHLLTLTITAFGIFKADHQAFLWLRGKTLTLNLVQLKRYHHWVGTGLTVMILTGFGLFYPNRAVLLNGNKFFLIKMMAVALLVINSFIIGRFMNVAATKPYANLTFSEKLPLMLSGAISFGCWVGAAMLAFFILPE